MMAGDKLPQLEQSFDCVLPNRAQYMGDVLFIFCYQPRLYVGQCVVECVCVRV